MDYIRTRKQFLAQAQPENAAAMQAYMKNKFAFMGIKSPLRKQLSKAVWAEQRSEKKLDLDFFYALWDAPERELQYLAMEYLYRCRRYWPDDMLHVIEAALTQKSWWDTVDYLASTVLGYYIEVDRSRADNIRHWILHENMWLNRAAILHQLKYKKETDTELLEECMLPHLDSQEFFLRKAIGWALREYSKTNPHWVRQFIDQNELSGLSLREASKYLTH